MALLTEDEQRKFDNMSTLELFEELGWDTQMVVLFCGIITFIVVAIAIFAVIVQTNSCKPEPQYHPQYQHKQENCHLHPGHYH